MSSNVLHLVGGRQKAEKDLGAQPEWQHYAQAVIVALDLETGRVDRSVTYESPLDVCPDENPSILFKAGSRLGDHFYACTQTEVVIYRLPDWSIERTVSAPCFNDVHHAMPYGARSLLVVSTGLDLVVEVDWDGEVLREWSVTGEDTWDRFSKETDYRKIATTKPHVCHPNYVFENQGALWATRANKGDAVCLTADRKTDRISEVPIHDGVLRSGSIYFTSVRGHVIQVNAETGQVERDFDLNEIVGFGTPLGWCRGLHWLDDDRIAVGFSRLRGTRWQRNVRWVKHRLGGDGSGVMPTRVAVFDLKRLELCAEYDVEPAHLNAIFSIHDLNL